MRSYPSKMIVTQQIATTQRVVRPKPVLLVVFSDADIGFS
jgi:hypothetical protein